jgi:hypothetical protein
MTSVSTASRLEGLPQLFAFYCVPCGFAEKEEQDNEAQDCPASVPLSAR